MKVLIACESSATAREAFSVRGHDAYSCDLLPSERPKERSRTLQGVADAIADQWGNPLAFDDWQLRELRGARGSAVPLPCLSVTSQTNGEIL